MPDQTENGPSNPLLKRLLHASKQSTAYHRSKHQEKQISKRTGGQQTLASGSLSRKGDVQVTGVARIEAKTTSKKSFSITEDMVDKIVYAGLGAGEIPAIIVEFLDALGKPKHELAVIPVSALYALLDKVTGK